MPAIVKEKADSHAFSSTIVDFTFDIFESAFKVFISDIVSCYDVTFDIIGIRLDVLLNESHVVPDRIQSSILVAFAEFAVSNQNKDDPVHFNEGCLGDEAHLSLAKLLFFFGEVLRVHPRKLIDELACL